MTDLERSFLLNLAKAVAQLALRTGDLTLARDIALAMSLLKREGEAP